MKSLLCMRRLALVCFCTDDERSLLFARQCNLLIYDDIARYNVTQISGDINGVQKNIGMKKKVGCASNILSGKGDTIEAQRFRRLINYMTYL